MMMYSTLERIFDDINPSLFENVDFTDADFCSKIFNALDDAWKPEGYSDEAVLLDEYEKAFVFTGVPNPFFEKIDVVVKKLERLGSKPNEKQTLKKASDAIQMFAMKDSASEADKTWGSWLQTYNQLERMAVRPITFDSLKQAASIHYDDYIRMKGNEMLRKTPQDLVQFNATSVLQSEGCRAQHDGGSANFNRGGDNDDADGGGRGGGRYEGRGRSYDRERRGGRRWGSADDRGDNKRGRYGGSG